MGAEGGGRQGEPVSQFADRQAIVSGLDQLAIGREAGLVAKGAQGVEGRLRFYNSNIPELRNHVKP